MLLMLSRCPLGLKKLKTLFTSSIMFSATSFGYENYSPHPEYKTSETFTWYNIPIWGWILIALPIMGVVAICLALAAWKIIAQLARYDSFDTSEQSSQSVTQPRYKCPLCIKKIRRSSWKNHRQKCAKIQLKNKVRMAHF